jgi:hypothetical protein
MAVDQSIDEWSVEQLQLEQQLLAELRMACREQG